MKNCPHCGGSLEPVKAAKTAKPKKKARRIAYINAKGKPVYRPAYMEAIMDARERGELTLPPSSDWFPRYMAMLPKSIELERQVMARVTYGEKGHENESYEEYQARRDQCDKDVEKAKKKLAKHKQYIFGKGQMQWENKKNTD